tara:strand:+ start:152 stop:307 length:156 start_codon:yes stop_codon:yes gene_type:complete
MYPGKNMKIIETCDIPERLTLEGNKGVSEKSIKGNSNGYESEKYFSNGKGE